MRGKLSAHLACRATILILACACAPAALAEGLRAARNLGEDARAAQAARVPLVVLFTQPDCAYCERLRREYLEPMAAQRADRVVEVDITSEAALAGFDGRSGTHASFARARGVRVTPTLAFLGARGEPLAEPLVGFTSPDFYQSYLERRLEEARAAVRRGKR
jgi:thioredoxin-related protein